MESLLALAFDNISSRDGTKIRKGLRQIEGVLAQICLAKSSSGHKRRASAFPAKEEKNGKVGEAKGLRELRGDAAFREFFRLQEGFRWNVASRLISTLERLLGMGSQSLTDLLIMSTLDLLQGTLLLHPPSRALFTREIHMNLLLDLLDAANPPKVQSQTLLVLVAALLDCPQNTRVFEQVEGLLTVTSLFKSRSTTREVRMRTLEFLYFYLMPEAPTWGGGDGGRGASTVVVQKSSPEHNAFAGHARTHSGDDSARMDVDELPEDVRSMEEKQEELGQYLSNVAELVADLQESAPFGVMAGG